MKTIACVLVAILTATVSYGQQIYGGINNPVSVSGSGASYTPADAALTVYVGKHGDDADSGLNFDNAKLTIQSGVDAAAALFAANTQFVSVAVGSGAYAEDVVVSNGVSISGESRGSCFLDGSITVAKEYTGGLPLSDFVIRANGTVGRQLDVKAGATGLIRFQNIGFQEIDLTMFTDVPVWVAGGDVIWDNVGLIADNPNFNSMGTAAGTWIVITNGVSFDCYNMQMVIRDMVNTNVSVAMIRDWATNEVVIKTSLVDLEFAEPTTATVSFYEAMQGGTAEKSILRNHIDIDGAGSTGIGKAFVARGSASVRFSGNDVGVEGFDDDNEISYEANNTSQMFVNGADDVASTGIKQNDSGVVIYTGSPEDDVYQVGGATRVVEDATNQISIQWFTSSNRWAAVQTIGTNVNVTFLSP